MNFATQNPANLETLKEYSYLSSDLIEQKIAQAFDLPRKRNIMLLNRVAESLRANKENLAKMASLEMGKPISDGIAEVEKCAVCCQYYFENAEKFLKDQNIFDGNKVVFDPLGPIFAIMPWNFPYWQLIRFAAPALAAGNSILMKHSDLTAGCAELIQEIFMQATDNEPWLQNLRIDHQQSANVIKDPRIRGVTFTGSSRGGSQVGQTAAGALKKSVLELGGSDAYLVLADADVEKAAEICAQARLVNNGQSCVAAKRFIVDQKIKDSFLTSFQKYLTQKPVGDPLSRETKRGPLAAIRFKEQLRSQVKRIVDQGGKKLFSEEMPLNGGSYYPAQALQVSAENSFSFTEELFGPVALVYSFHQEAEAIEIANKSIYGLGGAIFSKDLEKAESLAHKMECGFVAINDFVRSDPRLPFGGVKHSGYGRELGPFGILEFVNTKSITRPS